jgi:hypothetical protein
MAQPTTFSEFPRTFSSAVITNPAGVIVDTGVFDKTGVYKVLVILSGTVTGLVSVTHYDTDGVTVVDVINIVLAGAPAEFYWLWLVEKNQRIKVASTLTGTLAAALNIHTAPAGPSIGWM